MKCHTDVWCRLRKLLWADYNVLTGWMWFLGHNLSTRALEL